MRRRLFALGLLSTGFLCAACGSSVSSPGTPRPDSTIAFTPNGTSWNATPVMNALDTVSNNGTQYTGEIDVHELTAPITGRLQISLSWDQDSDFDLIVAADRQANLRLVSGLRTGTEPEYVGLDVVEGQKLFLLVAGWSGQPGGYTLETVLAPPELPLFALDGPDPAGPVASNLPIRLFFTQALQPDQDIAQKVAFVTPGHQAEGAWCIEGRELVFLPRLPVVPEDTGGLHELAVYTLQFVPAALGVRAANGEFLSELATVRIDVGTLQDEDPSRPPRVLGVDLLAGTPWDGSALTITLAGELDPDSLAMRMLDLGSPGTTLPFSFTLEQRLSCLGSPLVQLTVEAASLPPGGTVRLEIPGTVRGISGDPAPLNLVSGGAGYSIDLSTK